MNIEFVSLSPIVKLILMSYVHANESIGTVRQVYDGALYPDIAVNTFRNIDRLFPARVVKCGNRIVFYTVSVKMYTFMIISFADEATADLYHGRRTKQYTMMIK